MRKIITSTVLILSFSLFSGSVFAGKIAACEEIKHDPAYKGLYGLCNAYWNANPKHQDKFLAKFEKKAGPDGPGMPGLEEPDVRTEPEPAVCPCTDGMDTSTWGMTVSCSPDSMGGMIGLFVVPETNFTTELTVMSVDELYICSLFQSPATFVQLSDLDFAEFDACMTQLENLCL